MIFIKAIVLYITLLFIFYRAGLILNKFIKSNSYISIVLYGFISIMALLQIVYVPLILLHVPFYVVLYLTLFLIFLIIGCSFFIYPLIIEKDFFRKKIKKISQSSKKNTAITIISIIIILLQAGITSFLFNENADDSFYVSLMHENINSDKIYSIEPSLGVENTKYLSNYMISGYELMMSVISKIYSIPVTILCHTVMVFLLIIMSYMSYYVLLKRLCSKKNVKIALILLAIVFLFSGFTTRLRGIILLSRIWQGKEIFLNIVLTLIIENLISFKNYNRNRNTFRLIVLNFSAVFFSNTAIFLVPFTYLGFGVIALIKKRWRHLIRLILTGIPIAIYGIIFILTAEKTSNLGDTVNYLKIINDFIGEGKYHILYIVALIIIIFKGNQIAKMYYVFIPIIYLLTIYNPYFAEIIAKYLTGASVYWRVFWILPIEMTIIYALILILNFKSNKYYKTVIFIIEIVVIIISGKFVWTEKNGFEFPQNLSKIPQDIVIQTEFILNKVENDSIIKVMAPPEPLHSTTIRQLTSNITIFWSRDMYMKDIYNEEELKEMRKIYDIYFNDNLEISTTEFNLIRQKYDVNWIIINSSNQNNKYLEKTNYLKKYEVSGAILYKY